MRPNPPIVWLSSWQERQARVRRDGVAQFLELPVDSVPAQWGIEGERIEKDVDVFRESRDQIPAFQQARPALEDDLVAAAATIRRISVT